MCVDVYKKNMVEICSFVNERRGGERERDGEMDGGNLRTFLLNNRICFIGFDV